MGKPEESAGFGVACGVSREAIVGEQRGERRNAEGDSGGAAPEKQAARHRGAGVWSQGIGGGHIVLGLAFRYSAVMVSSRLRIMRAKWGQGATSRGSSVESRL